MSPRTFTISEASVSGNSQKADTKGTFVPTCVGQIPLSDYERELAIVRAGRLVEFFHAEYTAALDLYEREGGFEAIGAAHRARANADSARRLMEALISNRRAEFVKQREQALGLDVPACANEVGAI